MTKRNNPAAFFNLDNSGIIFDKLANLEINSEVGQINVQINRQKNSGDNQKTEAI
jgi:cell division protein FtsL